MMCKIKFCPIPFKQLDAIVLRSQQIVSDVWDRRDIAIGNYPCFFQSPLDDVRHAVYIINSQYPTCLLGNYVSKF